MVVAARVCNVSPARAATGRPLSHRFDRSSGRKVDAQRHGFTRGTSGRRSERPCRRKPCQSGRASSWSRLPLLVHDAIALLPPGRTAQLPHEGMTLKLGSRRPVLIDSIEVPAASANVSDEHVDVVQDDPSPTAVCDDAVPHVCDSQDDGASFISGTVSVLKASCLRIVLRASSCWSYAPFCFPCAGTSHSKFFRWLSFPMLWITPIHPAAPSPPSDRACQILR
jgi:hypothetical protein